MNKISEFKIKNGIVLTIALAVASMEGMIAVQIQYLYAYPSAYIASLFLGALPIITEGNEVLIPMSNQFINVTSKCSAFGFACLLSAILVINVMKLVPKSKILIGCILALPLAYLITIVANGSRIICAYYFHIVGRLILPLNFQSALHQGVGIAIFLSTLIVVTLIFERINYRGQKI